MSGLNFYNGSVTSTKVTTLLRTSYKDVTPVFGVIACAKWNLRIGRH
jgi:hypothetical protein